MNFYWPSYFFQPGAGANRAKHDPKVRHYSSN
jgi:hypothetical protein